MSGDPEQNQVTDRLTPCVLLAISLCKTRGRDPRGAKVALTICPQTSGCNSNSCELPSNSTAELHFFSFCRRGGTPPPWPGKLNSSRFVLLRNEKFSQGTSRKTKTASGHFLSTAAVWSGFLQSISLEFTTNR